MRERDISVDDKEVIRNLAIIMEERYKGANDERGERRRREGNNVERG